MGATPHVSVATSPFRRQAAGHWHLLPVSSVPTAHTHSSATPMRRQSSRTVNLSGQNGTAKFFCPQMVKKFVFDSTLEAGGTAVSTEKNMEIPASMPVLSVATNCTMPSLAPAGPIDIFLNTSCPPTLTYPSFSNLIIQRPLFNSSIHSHPDIFTKIVCPYNINAFATLLDKHNLMTNYPDLITNLRHGFPLSPMPELNCTHILPNHPTVTDYRPFIDEYLQEEVGSG